MKTKIITRHFARVVFTVPHDAREFFKISAIIAAAYQRFQGDVKVVDDFHGNGTCDPYVELSCSNLAMLFHAVQGLETYILNFTGAEIRQT